MDTKKEFLNPGGMGPLCFSMNSLVSPMKELDSSMKQNVTFPTTNSLNRRLKRKADDRDALCRSWGATDEDGDKDIWAYIQEPYNYIMDSQLVPDLYQTNEKSEFPATSELELSWDMDDVSPSYVWDFSQFLDQYNELYEWLIQVQVELYNPSTFKDKVARSAQQEELKRQTYRKKLFIEHCGRVVRKYPGKADEISWRVNYLTNKWEQLETAFSPVKGQKQEVPVQLDWEHEEKVLKSWLATMEGHIQPITCRLPKGCSVETLQKRFKDNQILLKDIKAHGPVLKDVIRQYEPPIDKSAVQEAVEGRSAEQASLVLRQEKKRLPRRARYLENRFHQIYLRSLEWHYHLERVIANFKECPSSSASDTDEEPVTKYRKLSFSSSVSSGVPATRVTEGWSDYENHCSETGSYIEDDYVGLRSSRQQNSPSFVTAACESLSLEPMLVEEQSHYAEKRFESENEADVNDSTAKLDSRTDMLGTDMAECEDMSSLASVERTSPNCGVFEYKHEECEVGLKATGAVTGRGRRLRPATTWKNRQQKLDDVYVDEDAVQEDLQKIIDDAIPEPNWLHSNIPTDSEGSVDSRSDVIEDRMDTDREASNDMLSSVATNAYSSTQRLIKGAERLVQINPMGSKDNLKPLRLDGSGYSKQRRIRQWISQQHEQDSCDASGELTTGESDVESNTSDKARFVGSLTLSPGSLSGFNKTPSAEGLRTFSSSTPKVHSRGKKRRQHEQRPWSITDVTQIPVATNGHRKYDDVTGSYTKVFSSSESALSHLKGSSSDTAVEGKTPTNPSCDQFGPLVEVAVPSPLKSDSSPTAEECKASSPQATSGDAGLSNSRSSATTSSLKRRKMKFRRKSNVSVGRRTLRSESEESTKGLSGRAEQCEHAEGLDLSGVSSSKHASLLTNLDESNPAKKTPGTLEVPSACGQLSPRGQVVRTPVSDFEPGTAPEDISSPSEQAWDSYQDTKYFSEPYSEDVDHDAARRLIDFGDDYTKYIDSDGSSWLSRPKRPGRAKKPRAALSAWSTSEVDSGSDLESIHEMLKESKSQLHQLETTFRRCCSDQTLTVELQEVIATANNHSEGLKKFIRDLQKEGIGLETVMKEAQGIVRRWETLQAEAVERQRQLAIMLQLQKQMRTFRLSLEEIGDQCESSVRLSSLDTPVQFQQKIKIAKEFLATAAKRREDLTALNLSVHTFLSDSNLVAATLKDDLADLYRLWDETQLRINGKISKLEGAETIWRLWEEQKMDLQKILKQDSDTLLVLGKAMQSGDMTDVMASNAQDVARLLNERRNIGLSTNGSQVSNIYAKSGDSSKLRFRAGGNNSDSATSGYESCSSDDLSERERRLAHLKRLARDLEATLVPGSKAHSDISETIADAEKQLSALQKQCQELLVRTTGPASDDNNISHPEIENLSSKRVRPLKTRRKLRQSKDSDWIRRVIRIAIPLQAALLLLLCVACLLEPNCCDSANTLNFNISPQLRFINGPPPV